MLRSLITKVPLVTRSIKPTTAYVARFKHEKSDDEMDQQYVDYFNKATSGWEVRKAINDLQGLDLVPEPKIVIAGLKACRRINDYAVAIRFLEAIKYKAASDVGKIWPYILQEIRPTLTELGINTPEEMGYDKPELAMADVYDMH
jgi:cytochrome c oxidase subunit 5a